MLQKFYYINFSYAPFVSAILKVQAEGLHIQFSEQHTESFFVRIHIIVADLPARAAILNHKQFNGGTKKTGTNMKGPKSPDPILDNTY